MKRRVFFGLSGGMGPVQRTLPVMDKFRQAGSTVAFSIYDDHAAKYLGSLGYSYLADDDPTAPAAHKMVPRTSSFYHLDHYYAQLGMQDESFVYAWIHHRIRMLQQFQPDLIVVDMSPHTVIAARYLGIPVVSVTQSCFIPDGLPLFYWGEAPRHSPKVTSVMNRLMDQLSLPFIKRMEDLNMGDVNIIPSIPELDPTQGDHIHYVGPIGISEEDQSPPPAEQPYIIVYPGRLYDTTGDSGLQIVQHVLAAFHERPERIIISCPDPLPDHLKSLMSENISMVKSFPQAWLRECSLYIHHGGHGSCLSSIVYGTPSLILPTHTEREFNARRMFELGVGEYILPEIITPEHLYRLAKHVIEDDYGLRVKLLQYEIRKRNYGGANEVFQLGNALQMQEAK